MATVILSSDNLRVNVTRDTSLREVALKSGASMEFGCRVGDCGTCIATVEQGMEYLSPINPKETKVFEMLNIPSETMRLMCQCRVISHEGEIVISYNPVC